MDKKKKTKLVLSCLNKEQLLYYRAYKKNIISFNTMVRFTPRLGGVGKQIKNNEIENTAKTATTKTKEQERDTKSKK